VQTQKRSRANLLWEQEEEVQVELVSVASLFGKKSSQERTKVESEEAKKKVCGTGFGLSLRR
jgi:hypothetical protein